MADRLLWSSEGDSQLTASDMRARKQEEADGSAYRDVADARSQIASFIDTYKRQRLHSALDDLSPDDYEEACSLQARAPAMRTSINRICYPV